LTASAIRSHMGGKSSRSCEEISRIYLQYTNDEDRGVIVVLVEARIPASTTNQRLYAITIRVHANGRRILDSKCTCPIGDCCKHIHKVLRRISRSPNQPIGGPSQHHLNRVARRERLVDQLERASVYIAFACKSELDSGSDYNRSAHIKENFNQEVLGVFFSSARANQCAKEYIEGELGHEEEFDNDDDDEDSDDDDDDYGDGDNGETFSWEDEDSGEHEFDKVWVERRPIEDASRRFRK